MRKYHASMLDESGKLRINPATKKTYYEEAGKEVKGHDKDCAWEGYLSVESCGCKSSGH